MHISRRLTYCGCEKSRVLDQVENLVAESGRFDPCLFFKEQIVV